VTEANRQEGKGARETWRPLIEGEKALKGEPHGRSGWKHLGGSRGLEVVEAVETARTASWSGDGFSAADKAGSSGWMCRRGGNLGKAGWAFPGL
jgi:hypothetical protein